MYTIIIGIPLAIFLLMTIFVGSKLFTNGLEVEKPEIKPLQHKVLKNKIAKETEKIRINTETIINDVDEIPINPYTGEINLSADLRFTPIINPYTFTISDKALSDIVTIKRWKFLNIITKIDKFKIKRLKLSKINSKGRLKR